MSTYWKLPVESRRVGVVIGTHSPNCSTAVTKTRSSLEQALIRACQWLTYLPTFDKHNLVALVQFYPFNHTVDKFGQREINR